MRKLIRLTFCDFCYEETDQEVPVECTFTFGITPGEERPALYVAETCARHAEPFQALMAQLPLLQSLAQLQQHATGAAKPAKRPAADGAKQYKVPRLVCAVCTEEVSNTALASHIWTMHLGQPRPGVPARCPTRTCDFQTKNPMAMAQHRRHLHDYSAVEEAYALVERRPKQGEPVSA